MLNSWRRLAGRKGKRSRQGGLTLEPLGERILLAAGSALPLLLGPTLAGSDGSGRSIAVADHGLDRLVPVSSYYDDPFVPKMSRAKRQVPWRTSIMTMLGTNRPASPVRTW